MNLNEAKQNIGKEVVLLKGTKPYFGKTEYSEDITIQIEEEKELIIENICADGSVQISGYYIKPEHIALKEQKNIATLTVDLDLKDFINQEDKFKIRLAILQSGNHSLDEMKEIEAWVLGA